MAALQLATKATSNFFFSGIPRLPTPFFSFWGRREGEERSKDMVGNWREGERPGDALLDNTQGWIRAG